MGSIRILGESIIMKKRLNLPKSVKSICLQFRIYRSKNNLNEIVEAFGLEKDPAYSQESAR